MYKASSLEGEKSMFVKETTWGSIIADTYSVLSLCFFFWFNYTFIGGSYFVNFIIFIVIVLKIASSFKKIHKFDTKEELIKFLQDQ